MELETHFFPFFPFGSGGKKKKTETSQPYEGRTTPPSLSSHDGALCVLLDEDSAVLAGCLRAAVEQRE